VAVDQAQVAYFRRKIRSWGADHRRSFPWRETDDAFRVLVAEVLLQRSRGKTVAKVYEELFRRWPDAEHLARTRVSSIASVIRPLGLVKRASTLKELAVDVAARGAVPDTLDGLLELRGVGAYAAGATLVVAFGKRAHVVDGVTARVYRRFFGLDGERSASNDSELWLAVDTATPARGVKEWNWAVLDLASEVCVPQIPRCAACPLEPRCDWAQTPS
jgi:A/G-specific adenine glycosylase